MRGERDIEDKTRPEPIEPSMAMLMLVEKTILDAEDYMTKADLFAALPAGSMNLGNFVEIVKYLETSGQIIFCADKKILWLGEKGPAFRAMLDRCVRVR